MKLRLATLALLSASIAAMPVLAHHSFAMFDFSNTVTLKGTVKEFRWTNPHVILLVMKEPANGVPDELWSMELTSPGNLTRMGWSRSSFTAGDKIELTFNPLRDGKHGGAFDSGKILATGQVFNTNLREAEKAGLQ